MRLACPNCGYDPAVEEAKYWMERAQNVKDAVSLILKETSEEYSIPQPVITGASRRRDVVEARFHAMSRISNELGLSLKEVGFYFSERDHSTVINALKRNPQFRANYALRNGETQAQDGVERKKRRE